jgi:hypothetical protein
MWGMEAANGQILFMKQRDCFRILGPRHMMTSYTSLLWPWCVVGFPYPIFSLAMDIRTCYVIKVLTSWPLKCWMNLLTSDVCSFSLLFLKPRGLLDLVFLEKLMLILPNLQKHWSQFQSHFLFVVATSGQYYMYAFFPRIYVHGV